MKHIYDTLTAGIADDAAKQRVTVECFAVTPLTLLYIDGHMEFRRFRGSRGG